MIRGAQNNTPSRYSVPADIVIFGGKTQASGVFFNPMTVQVSERDMIELSQGAPLNVMLFSVCLFLYERWKKTPPENS